ncbi:hypothetical protein EXIGLDRAFT_700739 [Exidia glandulosa HHB12029]|uniref:Uncharacterized protein n=1 Tax=Exidia glandulosa HHB12029 TaxID=1314781 RepID=A0A165DAZ8_EXIGL|nr:hypothetical protein EXIGLDRAFT_700739 [Exidia glandulosa HHB12029]
MSVTVDNAVTPSARHLTPGVYIQLMNHLIELVHRIQRSQVAMVRVHGINTGTLESLSETCDDVTTMVSDTHEAVEDIQSTLADYVNVYTDDHDAVLDILNQLLTRSSNFANALSVNETNWNLNRATLDVSREGLRDVHALATDIGSAVNDHTTILGSIISELDAFRFETAVGIAEVSKAIDSIRVSISTLAGAMSDTVDLIRTTGIPPGPPVVTAPPPTPCPSPSSPTSFSMPIRTATRDPRKAPYPHSDRNTMDDARD